MRAHARGTDPDTSHEAAAAITARLTDIQLKVAAYARRAGPEGFVDLEMEAALGDLGSTVRTRRGELAQRNIVLDSGRRRSFGDSPRKRVVWVHRDYVAGAPPICEPPEPLTNADRAEARQCAADLDQLATGFRKQGLAMAASLIDRAARLLARVGR